MRWLVTGAAGFIGSNLSDYLLKNGHEVVGLDNFYSGKKENLSNSSNFHFIEGDIRDLTICQKAMKGVDFVLHHAAFVSVPRSLLEPDICFDVNVNGFRQLLTAAKKENVKRFVYASSSAVYGDGEESVKSEKLLLLPKSPYAQTKVQNEIDARELSGTKMQTIGLRYFNIFGPRQDPKSPYSGVIAIWINGLQQDQQNFIFGDGTITRDFCSIENVLQANVSACLADISVQHSVFNIGSGQSVTLNKMYSLIEEEFQSLFPKKSILPIRHRELRKGDILHSESDIRAAQKTLNYEPNRDMRKSIRALFLEGLD